MIITIAKIMWLQSGSHFIEKPIAAIWLNNGNGIDLEKALKFARGNEWKVAIFPETEKDPLGKSKAVIQQGVSR